MFDSNDQEHLVIDHEAQSPIWLADRELLLRSKPGKGLEPRQRARDDIEESWTDTRSLSSRKARDKSAVDAA